LINCRDSDDRLRESQCHANLFHTAPSRRMQIDGLSQWIVARKWNKLLVLAGPTSTDAATLSAVKLAAKKFQLKITAERPFKLSADPRERELANVALLTANAEYDAIWVIDDQGDFARMLPYRTQLPRPVIGSAGLVAESWHRSFERFGAPQLSRRFLRAHKRPMTGADWSAWAAGKAIIGAALNWTAQNAGKASLNTAALAKELAAPNLQIDGFKGVRLSFRAWDRQLRQPILLTDGQSVLGTAPLEGFMHPGNPLDSVGADAHEKLCKVSA
jgi:ABC transporter substrate binding protein (PQQ-dependent alcohol dehydrogenase system)